LILKAATRYFIAFAVTAVLLIVADSLAFEQGDRGGSERQSSETASQAEALFQNALRLSDTQESESARLQLQAAMRLWVQMRAPGKAAQAALQMGDRSKQSRKYADALKYYRLALDVKSLPGAVRANALNAIALIYAELYQRDLAMRYFNQAFDQARRINDLPAQTLALTGLADLYRQQGAMEKALACITQALRLSKSGQADTDPALLYLMGQVSQEQGAVEKAKGDFQEALAIYRKTCNTVGQVKVLCAISTLSRLASQKQAALEQAEQAVELAEKQAKRAVSQADLVNSRELQWPAWLSCARAERALGQEARAARAQLSHAGHCNSLEFTRDRKSVV